MSHHEATAPRPNPQPGPDLAILRLDELGELAERRLDKHDLDHLHWHLTQHAQAGFGFTALSTRMIQRLIVELMAYRARDESHDVVADAVTAAAHVFLSAHADIVKAVHFAAQNICEEHGVPSVDMAREIADAAERELIRKGILRAPTRTVEGG